MHSLNGDGVQKSTSSPSFAFMIISDFCAVFEFIAEEALGPKGFPDLLQRFHRERAAFHNKFRYSPRTSFSTALISAPKINMMDVMYSQLSRAITAPSVP